jgi:hypothetical protein
MQPSRGARRGSSTPDAIGGIEEERRDGTDGEHHHAVLRSGTQ